eukprot:IDg21102t1
MAGSVPSQQCTRARGILKGPGSSRWSRAPGANYLNQLIRDKLPLATNRVFAFRGGEYYT